MYYFEPMICSLHFNSMYMWLILWYLLLSIHICDIFLVLNANTMYLISLFYLCVFSDDESDNVSGITSMGVRYGHLVVQIICVYQIACWWQWQIYVCIVIVYFFFLYWPWKLFNLLICLYCAINSFLLLRPPMKYMHICDTEHCIWFSVFSYSDITDGYRQGDSEDLSLLE